MASATDPHNLSSVIFLAGAFTGYLVCTRFSGLFSEAKLTSQVATHPKTNFANRLQEVRSRLGKTRDEMGKLLEISGNYVYLLETGKKSPSHKVISRLEKLELSYPEKSQHTTDALMEDGGGYNVPTHHKIITHSKLAAACVAHFEEYLGNTGDGARNLEWTLEKLREVFPLDKWSAGPADMDSKKAAKKSSGDASEEPKIHAGRARRAKP